MIFIIYDEEASRGDWIHYFSAHEMVDKALRCPAFKTVVAFGIRIAQVFGNVVVKWIAQDERNQLTKFTTQRENCQLHGAAIGEARKQSSIGSTFDIWSEFRECHSLNMSKEKIESLSTWWTDGKPYLRCPQTTEEALREESTDIWWEIWENGSRGRIFRLIFAPRCDILWLMFLSSSLCQVIIVRCVSLSLSLTSEISGEVPWNPLKPPRRKIAATRRLIQFFWVHYWYVLPAHNGLSIFFVKSQMEWW